jgi:Zn-dependent peptidase ImmA (M78 family)
MNRDSEIEELAELIAEEHWRYNQVDPAAIASAYGLTFNFGHYDDVFDGLLESQASRFHVYINLDSNKAETSPRARFSFAHELGHYFIDWHRCALERGAPPHGSKAEFESNSSIEREADLFAANLLMPRDKVRRELRQAIRAEEIQRLAQIFGTSLSAMAIRCAHLSVAPLIVMKWSDVGRAWCWSSERFSELTGNKSYRALHRIPPDSVTRQMIEGDSRNNTESPRGTTLATWFPGIRAGSNADEILVEECIGLGRYGVLTILRQP